jgi:hypothetical protein
MSSTATAPAPRALSDAEVARLDPYAFFAVLGKRVQVTAVDIAPRMLGPTSANVSNLSDRISGVRLLYTAGDLADVQVETGPFDMMTPAGFLHDEGFANAVVVLARAMSRWCHARNVAWLVPRVARAVPYLGSILVSGTKAS